MVRLCNPRWPGSGSQFLFFITLSRSSRQLLLASPNHQHNGPLPSSDNPPPLPPPLLRRLIRLRALPGIPSSHSIAQCSQLTPQTFINTKICFTALPMREFLVLQKRLFPVYFRTQLGLVALTAVTRPPGGIGSFLRHVSDAVPLVVVVVTGGLNEWVFGPRTTRDAFVRKAVHGECHPFWVVWSGRGLLTIDRKCCRVGNQRVREGQQGGSGIREEPRHVDSSECYFGGCDGLVCVFSDVEFACGQPCHIT